MNTKDVVVVLTADQADILKMVLGNVRVAEVPRGSGEFIATLLGILHQIGEGRNDHPFIRVQNGPVDVFEGTLAVRMPLLSR